MTKRTFKRKKMLISNTYKLIIIGNYHTVPIQILIFNIIIMIVINTQKDFLGPTVIKVSGKDLTG